MKKITLNLILALSALVLAACGSAQSAPQANVQSQNSATQGNSMTPPGLLDALIQLLQKRA